MVVGKYFVHVVDASDCFVNPGEGHLLVPGARATIPTLANIVKSAHETEHPVIMTTDAHYGTPKWSEYEDELKQYGGPWLMHSKKGSDDQLIIPELSVGQMTYIENVPPNGTKIPYLPQQMQDLIGAGGVVFEKQTYNAFSEKGGNVHLPDFVNFLIEEGYGSVLVMGFATDYCTGDAVDGYLTNWDRTELGVYVVTDAIAGIDEEASQKRLEELVVNGAILIESKDIE